MGGRTLLSAALCVPLLSCSLLFSSADPEGNDVPEPCRGVQRHFERGAEIGLDRYEHLDYAQGSITFWVETLFAPTADEATLVDLAGLSIRTNPEGDLVVAIPGMDAPERFPAVVDWEEGEEVFVALRWDSKRPVSGSAFPPSHFMLRVGERDRYYGAEAGLTIAPGENSEILVGDADGEFDVSQLVVYGRPLYVSNDTSEEAPDELRAMARAKTEAAQLVRGGLDVSFATSAPQRVGCTAYEAKAWSMPQSALVPGDPRAGDTSGWEIFPTAVIPEEERTFSSGLAVRIDSPAGFQMQLVSGRSYHFYALAHGTKGAIPLLRISAVQTEPKILVQRIAPEGSTDEPQSIVGTFTMPTDARTAAVVLANGNTMSDGLAIFHTLVITENMLTNSGFETPEDGFESGEVPEPWEVRAPEGNALRFSAATSEVNTGTFSVCFDGSDHPNDLYQQLDGDTLVNGDYYTMGASFFWPAGETEAPGVSTGNSSFFSVGDSHEERKRAASEIAQRDRWQPAGTVGYRLFGQEFGATNELIFFGSLGSQPEDTVEFCVDDAYLFPVESVPGTTE